jgi:uncharacterized protein
MRELIGDEAPAQPGPAQVHRRNASACRPCRTSCKELEKPGRDPRPEFKTAIISSDGIEDLKDLEPGMQLEGVVTNVTLRRLRRHRRASGRPGAHLGALRALRASDPHEVVKAGDVVKVKVLEVDVARKRIALTMRLADEVRKESAKVGAGGTAKVGAGATAIPSPRGRPQAPVRPAPAAGAMAEAFARLKR